MKVTAVDLVDVSGTLTELTSRWNGEPRVTDLPVSFNQANHLRAHHDRHSASGWLAGAVDLGVRVADPMRAACAVTRLIAEQQVLRTRFRAVPSPRQDVFDSRQVSVRPHLIGDVDRGRLASWLDSRCVAGPVPGIAFGLLDDSLVCGFDHAHADALTIDLVLRRLSALYADPDALPRPGRDVAARFHAESRRSTPSDADLLAGWQEFFAATGGRVPTFPLPLGPVAPRTPARTRVETIVDAEHAERLGRRPFATILATLAATITELGGPDELAALIPVHTRGRRDADGWHDTAGWFVTNAPVRVRAADIGVPEPRCAARWTSPTYRWTRSSGHARRPCLPATCS